MTKLTSLDAKALRALSDRSMDMHDLSDAVGITPQDAFILGWMLREANLIHWMYLEDEASITPAGRAALEARDAG